MAVAEQEIRESPKAKAIREEARAWFEENWDPDLTMEEWWQRLFEGRWTAPTWPEEWYGRGLSGDLAKVVAEERRRVGAPGGPGGLGIMLAGPTIVTHGTDEQREKYLPGILTGQDAWCQLFSEPGAGSDLASLQTKAVLDGDEWTVTGQKVWSSGAQHADLGMLIARTDVEAPKHQGITYFIIDMDQPGIEIRPIVEMTGRALFNEVFLDDARMPADRVLGGLGNGWAVANTTLANERAGLGGVAPGKKAGFLTQKAGDLGKGGGGTGTGAIFRGKGSDLIVDTAKKLGKIDDANLRQEIARLYTLERISEFTALRIRAAAKSGKGPGSEVSTMKLNMSRIVRLVREAGLKALGAHGMLMGRESETGGVIQEAALFSPAPSIYGGTDEIQKNIIGERVLGLPKEPGPDKNTPFKDLKVGTQAG
ncbi:MAG TPA: acyl-CoA dehydrogenase family protein [Acidimicrobiia bacterium]|nr:acyl-CoA dehydrogenase family protein [Acidimicrobiia bacterium]